MEDEDHRETLLRYINRLERKREIYQSKYKNDPVYQEENRKRAREHYHANKEKQSALKLYRYYVKHKSKEEFVDYHPDKFVIISDTFTLDEIDDLL